MWAIREVENLLHLAGQAARNKEMAEGGSIRATNDAESAHSVVPWRGSRAGELPGQEERAMVRVLLAVDDSEASVAAAAAAHRLFGDSATYLAVNVSRAVLPWLDTVYGWGATWPVPSAWTPGTPPVPVAAGDPETVERSAAEQTARHVAEEADLTDARAVSEVGEPAQAILAAADEHQADVIVVGSHDRSWFSRLFVPSVSRDVIGKSEIPVLVVK